MVSEAMQNYLETIHILSCRQDTVHAVDVCQYLNYSRPTVSVALRQLREAGYVQVDGNNHITLTPKGAAVAFPLYERHNVLAQLLMRLGVGEKTAYADACKIEHDLSEESFSRIRAYYDVLERGGEEKK